MLIRHMSLNGARKIGIGLALAILEVVEEALAKTGSSSLKISRSTSRDGCHLKDLAAKDRSRPHGHPHLVLEKSQSLLLGSQTILSWSKVLPPVLGGVEEEVEGEGRQKWAYCSVIAVPVDFERRIAETARRVGLAVVLGGLVLVLLVLAVARKGILRHRRPVSSIRRTKSYNCLCCRSAMA